jgi:hypothetical protein
MGKIIEVEENDNGCLVTFLRPSQGKPKEVHFTSGQNGTQKKNVRLLKTNEVIWCRWLELINTIVTSQKFTLYLISC